jgi:uroporphyrinogen-III synthase
MALPLAEELARRTLVACIGPTTAEVAAAAGLSVHAVARERSAQGLARAAAWLAGTAAP